MITFKRVTKRYQGAKDALSDINFTIPKGTMAFLTGHSGAGKTTLFKLIALMERHTYGQIRIMNQDVSFLTKNERPNFRRKIGLIFQNPHLLADRTIFDNVALPLIIEGCSDKEIVTRVRQALKKVQLADKERMYPDSLSGGEKQRAGIARAIITNPPLLLADEPTGNLDPELAKDIMQLFKEINDAGTTIIIASHDLVLLNKFKYPKLVLKEGKLIVNELEEQYCE